jgi:Leucine-rich repeat (LRR) protein
MNQNEKQHIVELLCTSEPENIALAEAFCDSQNFPLETILREFGYWDVGIRCAEDFTKDTLDCNNMEVKKMPDMLPNALKGLYCQNNQLTVLPDKLPINLKYLDCGYNKLTALPENLPATLNQLLCYDNQIKFLPLLPNGLDILNFINNQITDLPNLPTTLRSLNYMNNPIRLTTDQIKQLAPKGCVI